MIIVPAILTDEAKTLEWMIRLSESFTDYVQVDIMDGKFVPSRSIAASDLGKIKTSLRMEAHLMVEDLEGCLKPFKEAGCERIIFHFEAASNPSRTFKKIKELDLETGLALNPDTPISKVEPFIEAIDFVLLMSVHPGFYGAKFIPEVLNKARELRRLWPEVILSMDGGLKSDNILEVKEAGVDLACVGSRIFKADDPREAFLKLKKLAA